MPCQAYKNAELRAHLAACSDCRSTFELEQSLFTSIDSGLRRAGNSEVPASLLPRIRARLDETPTPMRFWSANWLVFASAAALLVASFTAYSLWRARPANPSPAVAKKISPSVSVKPSQPSPAPAHVFPEKRLVSSAPNTLVARAPMRQPPPDLAAATPEVLVPDDDALALASYAQQWSSRERVPLIAGDPNETTVALLEVSPIQIPELAVKPLAEVNSQ